ncbi:hypothetical protein RND71_040519 [Anisodus tanguticus]|uniref:Uncharacterized protein n=1 Tax=Anisodus tanguticus TaxID=243964 RepID=A0AAE1QVS4_9SOLA|nr:hypothetical protein RND71_040519 [Anisodus tanguticus]
MFAITTTRKPPLSSKGARHFQQGWCIAYLSFSLGSQNEHAATYQIFGPSTRHSTFVESEPTPPHCARTVERPSASNFRARDIDSFFVLVRPQNPSRVGKKSVLFGKTELDKEKRVIDRNNGQQRP